MILFNILPLNQHIYTNFKSELNANKWDVRTSLSGSIREL